jgi:hypothetical protein
VTWFSREGFSLPQASHTGNFRICIARSRNGISDSIGSACRSLRMTTGRATPTR